MKIGFRKTRCISPVNDSGSGEFTENLLCSLTNVTCRCYLTSLLLSLQVLKISNKEKENEINKISVGYPASRSIRDSGSESSANRHAGIFLRKRRNRHRAQRQRKNAKLLLRQKGTAHRGDRRGNQRAR